MSKEYYKELEKKKQEMKNSISLARKVISSFKKINMKTTKHTKVQIIYKNHKPYGFRDDEGFLLFFTRVSKYGGQEDRYREEVEEQYKFADKLKDFIENDELLKQARNLQINK